ncbi:immunoglobulin superfamily member 10 [Pleuronectes platessa]|uniref:immunoglobulin superfamily member 10 n=1 Tax=Pleuronectes platessa TaxID=8262 RepID=UPI00232A5940|nr:immunoglobulin superfamily member 10 [Pleuronectes platessa]
MSSRLLLSVLLLLLCGRAAQAALSQSEDEDAWSPARMVADPPDRVIVVKEGSDALIECNVTRGHTLKWFSPQGAELGGEAGEKWQIEENGSLNISLVSIEDEGRFTCVTTSDGGATKNYTVTLRVAYRVIVVQEGSDALIECNVNQGHTVKWFSPQGAELGEEAGEKWQIEENGSLNISALSFDHRGRYTCVTTSDGGATRNYTVLLCVAYSSIIYYWVPWCLQLLMVFIFLFLSNKHCYIFFICIFIFYLLF